MFEFLQTQITLLSLLIGLFGLVITLTFDGWHRTIFNRIGRELIPVKQWITGKFFLGVFLLLSRLPIILKPVSAQKSPNGLAIMIQTELDGRNYHIWMPFQRNLIRSMSGKSIKVINEGSPDAVYQLYPGVPFTLTAKQMGGQRLQIIDQDNNVLKEFIGDEVVSF